MSINLLIHNVGYIISALVCVVATFFLLLNNPKAKGHLPFAITFLAVIVFALSHVLGVSEANPELSRKILMFNISTIFIGLFNVHAVLSLLKKDREKWYMLVIFYIFGFGLATFFVLNPEMFLHTSIPKMYFPNYYVPGVLHWARIVWIYIPCVLYILYELLRSARQTENVIEKKRLKFLAFAFFVGYAVAFIPNFLIFNIAVDPLWGMTFFVIFGGMFIYAGVRYEILNIKVIAKQAFIYSMVVAAIGGTIILFEYLNRTITQSYPGFPSLIVPSISIGLVIIITLIVWKKIREVDLLKYEFITTVTHKFRTPLTQIKWAGENLANSATLSADDKLQLEYIKNANTKLVELTNVLFNISDFEDGQYHYSSLKNSLSKTSDEVIASLISTIESKKIQIKKTYTAETFVKYDEQRIKFVMQTFIENAVHYSPEGSTIEISITNDSHAITFAVKDSGIGISKQELPLIFLKFYRGNKARTSDTEGMGIGLYISKGILERHKGTIHVSSEGQGLGSTFSFTLPIKG